MAAAQKAMDEGMAQTENRVQQMSQENASMPDFSALANVHSTLSNMTAMRKKNQVNDLATKLGVDVQATDYDLDAESLSTTLMQRAKESGKSDEEIQAAFAE